MRSVPRLLVLLASALPACLLYTDPINEAPRVTIVAPDMIQPGTVTFTAKASDPDGDVPTLLWFTAHKPCTPKPSDSDWSMPVTLSPSDGFDVTVVGHDILCVRVVAQDRHGARSDPSDYPVTPKNRPPVVGLTIDGSLDPTAVPLYSQVRLVAGPDEDEDKDPVTFTWKGTDAAGAALDLSACDTAHPNVRCFSAAAPGPYTVSVVGSDGVGGTDTQSLKLTVLPDAPPCIEASDPSADTDLIVLASTDPPRHFEVRAVRDDGNPFPPGAHGGTTFQWSTARDVAGAAPMWRRELGYGATFDVGAALFDDVRPGSSYLVRVEVRDPAHQSAGQLLDLQQTCQEKPICKVPDTCVRWLTWSVRFR